MQNWLIALIKKLIRERYKGYITLHFPGDESISHSIEYRHTKKENR